MAIDRLKWSNLKDVGSLRESLTEPAPRVALVHGMGCYEREE